MLARIQKLSAAPAVLVNCQQCVVRQLAPCRGVPEEALLRLQAFRSKQSAVASKAHLYRQGEMHSQAYTLHSGWVMLYKTLRTGKRQILRYALPGDFIGLQTPLHGPLNHAALVLADVVLCAFPRQSVMEMLEKLPQFAAQLTLHTLRDFEQLGNIAHRSAQERIAALFLDLCTRCQPHQALSQRLQIGVPMPITQEDIADTLGLTQVHVNRTLRLLRQLGVLEFQHHQLTIFDYPALCELAGYEQSAEVNTQSKRMR